MSLINPLYPLNNADLSSVADPDLLRFLKNVALNIQNINSRAISQGNLDSGIIAGINPVPVNITFAETDYIPSEEDKRIAVDSSGGITNIDLPDDTIVPEGWEIEIYDLGTATGNDITITPPTGGEIDNEGINTAITLNIDYSAVRLQHIGSNNYRILSSRNYA
jgi:hypothetical protein